MKTSFPSVTSNTQINEISRMASEIWREAYSATHSQEQIEYMLNLFLSPGSISEQIDKEGFMYCFIEYNGTTAGFFGVCPRKEGNTLLLSKLYLFKEFRGKGLFEASMEEIRQITIREKLPAIRLHVNKQNTRAINAYKKYGFAVVEIKAFDIGHGYFMDDYVMEYALK
ncbi:MAG: GNAT family N-acetyltransferase [Bacteroidales bacterium]|nr:GNAT family N-acetyltransferase [Bacteroidales bacterium]